MHWSILNNTTLLRGFIACALNFTSDIKAIECVHASSDKYIPGN